MKSFLRLAPIGVALSLTAILLVLISTGEIRKNFYHFRLDSATVQSESLLKIIRRDLENGTTLNSLSGLHRLCENLVESAPTLIDVTFLDEDGQVVTSVDPDVKTLADQEEFLPSRVVPDDKSYSVFNGNKIIQLSKVVDTRFGQAGTILLHLNKTAMNAELTASTLKITVVSAGLLVFFYLLVMGVSFRFANNPKWLKRAIQICYLLFFILISGVIVQESLTFYTNELQAKSAVLGKFLAKRLSFASKLGIDLSDLSGINETLASYENEHNEISAIDLVIGGSVAYSARNKMQPLQDDDVITHSLDLDTAGGFVSTSSPGTLVLLVKISRSIIRKALYDSAANLMTLLFACGLLANLILEIGAKRYATSINKNNLVPDSDRALNSIQTSYLIMGFINAMTLPFLAPLLKEMSGHVVSLPFTMFFICFAVFMIPAGKLAQRGYTRHLLLVSIFMEIVGCLIVACSSSIELLTIGRCFSGLGQGVFLIGFQSFIINVTEKERRTQGQALKVVIRYTVLMSGSAIGALMYVFLDYSLVFFISAGLGLFAFLYSLLLIPDPNLFGGMNKDTIVLKKSDTMKVEFRSILDTFKDKEFLATLFLSGIPSKIAVAGIIMFSIPLLLSEQHVATESIGRYLMLYYVACMFCSHWSAKIADASGKTRRMLFGGALVGGLSFAVLGGASFQAVSGNDGNVWLVVLMGASVLFGGISNGLTAAPILTHVGKTDAAKHQGTKSIVSVYCFAERLGHIVGPALLAFGATAFGNMGLAIMVFGISMVVLGLVFKIISSRE